MINKFEQVYFIKTRLHNVIKQSEVLFIIETVYLKLKNKSFAHLDS